MSQLWSKDKYYLSFLSKIVVIVQFKENKVKKIS